MRPGFALCASAAAGNTRIDGLVRLSLPVTNFYPPDPARPIPKDEASCSSCITRPQRSHRRGASLRSRGRSTGGRASLFRPIAALGWLFVTFVLATGPLQLAVPDQSGSAYFSAAALGGLAVLGAVLASDLRRARSMTLAGQEVERVEVGLLRGRVIATGEVAHPSGPAPHQLGGPGRSRRQRPRARRRRWPVPAGRFQGLPPARRQRPDHRRRYRRARPRRAAACSRIARKPARLRSRMAALRPSRHRRGEGGTGRRRQRLGDGRRRRRAAAVRQPRGHLVHPHRRHGHRRITPDPGRRPDPPAPGGPAGHAT